ncbi:MAG: TetR/AcrR family transcriptional regulator [Mycobacterium sp.]
MNRRKPNGTERRTTLCDTAIQLLADEGAKGLSHPKVDQRAGLPAGSTSFYFRTRTALLLATAQRVCELDLADLSAVLHPRREVSTDEGPPDISPLAALIVLSAQEPRLSRTKARIELILQANRDPSLAEVFRESVEMFADVQRDIVIRSQPDRDLDPMVINEQASATQNFVSGVFMRLVAGQRAFDDGEHLDRILSAIINGIAAAYQDRSSRNERISPTHRSRG